ncbi:MULTISPECIES: LysE family translocator [Acinetobacter]|uniref:LysE family translocator n=1 Tax=Acinetobacter tibetensis TaxID=2943497 RepID=A0AAE9S1D6_9GAMM|nr:MULTISPECIES: LysE family translocator [Acinetobacter]PWB14541.1 lysine transporter LysE [Acinetobacter sp. AM]USE84742.1 LysE family translocator [Acinetobacter tibetensis]
MSVYYHEFLTLALIHFLAVIIPGPDFIISVRQSTQHGYRIGCMTAVGIGCGISVHVFYTLMGVGLVLSQNHIFMSLFQIIGALYLLYLGWNCLKGGSSPIEINTDVASGYTKMSYHQAFMTGFWTNALNPKATIFFLAIFTSIVSTTTPLYIQILYGGWMCLVNTLWFIVVSLIFTRPKIRSGFLKYNSILEKVMGLLLAAIAIRLILGIEF